MSQVTQGLAITLAGGGAGPVVPVGGWVAARGGEGVATGERKAGKRN